MMDPRTLVADLDPRPLVGDIERLLCEVLTAIEPERPLPGPRRPRILPALALWGGLLVSVLRGCHSQVGIWRLLCLHGLWSYPRFPVTDRAVYQRLDRADGTALQPLFEQVSTVLAERLTPYTDRTLAPFAAEVVAFDDCTLDQIARLLPALRGVRPGDDRLLPGKLSCAFDLRRQQFQRVVWSDNPHQNEKVGAWSLLAGLRPGSLVVADLGYFAFRWFDALTDAGHFWISRLRQKTSFTVQHTFYQDGQTFDGLVWLGKYRADQAAHAVRLVRFTVGSTTFSYLTNVLDPRVLPLHEIARVYARRWDLELAFKLVKRELRLHLLWSAKDAVILHQIWAVLIIAQILQAVRLEIAARARVDLFEVSLPLLVQEAPRLAAAGRDPVEVFVTEGRRFGFIRPSRRTRVHTPTIDLAQIIPRPPEMVLLRTPRYANKDCGPRLARN